MTKEEVFNKINDVYEEWDGGQIHLDMTSVDQIKDIIQEAINYTHCCKELKNDIKFERKSSARVFNNEKGIWEFI